MIGSTAPGGRQAAGGGRGKPPQGASYNFAAVRGASAHAFPPWVRTWSDRIVVLSLFLLPLAVAPGVKDTFRLPKDALFRGEAIVLIAIYFVGWIERLRFPPHLKFRNRAGVLAMAILGWTAVTTLCSTNRSRSLDALVTVSAGFVIFFAMIDLARRHRTLNLIWIAIVPAILNAAVGILQELDIWNPFNLPEDLPHHLRSTALIGNPNDAGGYLAAVALATLAAALVSKRHRILFTLAAVVLAIGLIVNQTLTGIAALLIAGLAMSALRSWRLFAAAATTAIFVFGIALLTFAPFRERAQNVRDWLRAGDYNAITTQRLTAFTAALLMARDHPLVGVGPGCFSWQYFPYKIKAETLYPRLRNSSNRATNFGEVHNDHLQTLAEGGVPAYALLLGAVAAVGALSLGKGKTSPDEAAGFTHVLSLPLACAFIVLALAQFPLELTAVLSQFLFLSALCIGWSE